MVRSWAQRIESRAALSGTFWPRNPVASTSTLVLWMELVIAFLKATLNAKRRMLRTITCSWAPKLNVLGGPMSRLDHDQTMRIEVFGSERRA